MMVVMTTATLRTSQAVCRAGRALELGCFTFEARRSGDPAAWPAEGGWLR